jgi:carbamoyl-phosphate synthase large subunit
LDALGVPIIGTDCEAIAKAENRKLFEALMHELNIPEPEGKTVFNLEDGLVTAHKITYPVLVRPSYVLGGRAMEIVYDDDHLQKYLTKAFALDPNQPVLIDKYVVGREIEVDAICDGEDVFMPGIMQHIEGTGIHSGDSISVYPAYSLSKKVEDTIKDYTKRLGVAIGIKGLFNIQYIVDPNDDVYIIEVNPRSSRTIPYLSKSSKINLAKIATFVMLGDKLKDMNLVEPTPNMYYVKVPCFSFSKIRGLDTVLSPEMKSTGEAIGYDQSLNRALYKALKAANMRVINYGTVFVTLSDMTKEKALPLIRRFYNLGFNIEATKGTGAFLKSHGIKTRIKKKLSEGSEEILDSLRKGHVSYVINTVSPSKTNNDGFLIRRVAAENNITCFTSLDTVNALLDVLDEITIKVGTI